LTAQQAEQSSLPSHVGIIMDGNGRWAAKQNLPRTKGHEQGIEAAKRVVLGAIDYRIPFLSLYAFSTENWQRTEEEVGFLMALLARNLRGEYDFYRANNVRVVHSGDIASLPKSVRTEIQRVTEDTADNDAITVNLAVNYGGQDEIVRAANRWLEARCNSADQSSPTEPKHISAEELARFLDLPFFPPPDLIVRTGGEVRLSNFLLWGSAYAELYFSEKLWPNWDASDLAAAVEDYRHRKRNFGGKR
jgi:undecaprenyl diphosphate synthase